ncbi:ATP-binding protein [Candidatus Woesearchaeota archaeon]|nr:ATP-binding protein [Candidatus Woesearchaeota archaeon]
MEKEKGPNKNPKQEIIELIKFVSKNKLDKDPRIKALIRSLAANPSNAERKEQLLRLLQPYIVKDALSPDPFSPGPEASEVDGEVRLGLSHPDSRIFGLNLVELMQGTLIVGRPGAGKTTLTYNLIEKANELGIHSLVLDIKKDYRHLVRKLPNTLVFRADSEDFKWNPLEQPEEVDRVSHITNFADITAEAHAIYHGTNSYIVEHLNWIFTKNPHPTLFDLYNVIRHDKPPLNSRTARYKESAENRLASILVKVGNAIKYKKGYRIEKLIDDYNIVIELDNLGNQGCIYLSSLILSHVFQYRIANNLRGIKQKPALVIIDEANEIFDKGLEKKISGGLTLISMARKAREFQLGIVASCQVPDAISDTVKNVYTRVLLNLPEGANLKNMAVSMGLVKEQQEANFDLQEGRAVVRLAGRYTKPFLVQVSPYEIKKDVSNKEVREHMEKYISKLGVVEEPEAEVAKDTANKEQALEIEEKTFLLDVYNRPFLNQKERRDALNITSASKGTDLVKELDKKKLIKIIEINVGGRGQNPKLLAFEDEGFEAIEMPRKNKIHKSNFEHSFWQDRISKHFSKEYKTYTEKNIRGKHIDVAVETEKGIIAIEVAMTPVYEKNNIIKDLEAGCEKVIIGCRDNNVLEEVNKIIENLEDREATRTRAYLLPEILNIGLSHV